MSTEITINQDIVEINVTEEVVVIEAPSGAYPLPTGVYSVFGRTGNVVAQEGDYNLTQLGDVTITSPSTGQVLKYNGTTWVNGTDTDTGLTSVGLSMPSAFSVANSPLTANGTLSVTGAGTTAQYVRGDGTLATFPTIAQEAQRLITEVYNSTGATLTKGTVVYINGGQGNLPTVTKAIATGDATSAQTYGVVQSDITNMNNGFVVAMGSLTNLDTQIYPVGTQLYLSGTTAGAWTSVKPYAPIHLVYVGIVVRSHPTQGIVEIRIQNGYELDELHDVSAQNPNNGDILQYVAATDLWTKVAGTTTNIAEGTNLYYTDARSRAAFSESVTGLDYNSTTGVLSTTSGFGIPTTASQSTWNTAYNRSLTSAAVTGTTTKTLTLNQQDGGTITASWTDINTDAVTSVFGRTGAVVAASGDYTTTQVTEGTNLYFTNTRAQNAITLTTTGTSGAATYSGGTLNIPQYQGVLTNPVTGTGTTNTLPKFTGASTIGNSNITDSGSLITLGSNSFVNGNLAVGANSAPYSERLYIQGDTSASNAVITTSANSGISTLSLNVDRGLQGGVNIVADKTNQLARIQVSNSDWWPLVFQVRGADGTIERMRITNIGSVGIGATSLGQYNLRVSKNITGGSNSFGIVVDGTIQSGVTNIANIFSSNPSTQAATFNLGALVHYNATLTSIGAGNTINNQFGFLAENTLVGATNNYGFFGNIPSGTNRWNLYMNGTANNYMAGSLGIGSTSLTGRNLQNSKSITGSGVSYAQANEGVIQSDVTTAGIYYRAQGNTAAATFTTDIQYYNATQGTFGAGSTVTNQYGFLAGSTLIGATNNYGFFGSIPSGTNRWNLYMAGTAANYMAGDTAIGTTALGTATILTIGGTETAVSAISRGQLINTTLVASANNDVLVGLDIIPTYTLGAFTGVSRIALRLQNNLQFGISSAGSAEIKNISSNGITDFLGGTSNTGSVNFYGGPTFADGAGVSVNGNGSANPSSIIFYRNGFNAIGRFFPTGNFILQTGGTFTDLASAKLIVNSTTQGFLPPRMTSAQRAAISSPATGLMVYQTDGTEGVYVFSGGSWKSLTMV